MTQLEKQAAESGLLLRLQVRAPIFNLWTLRLVVAEQQVTEKVQILGEMKAWAYAGKKGLQLDTLQVHSKAPAGVGHLVWAATMAWALENTPCRSTRLLAIRDDDFQHQRLVRYFLRRGFHLIREVGAAPQDLPLRVVWGGAGALMVADCFEVFKRSNDLWGIAQGPFACN